MIKNYIYKYKHFLYFIIALLFLADFFWYNHQKNLIDGVDNGVILDYPAVFDFDGSHFIIKDESVFSTRPGSDFNSRNGILMSRNYFTNILLAVDVHNPQDGGIILNHKDKDNFLLLVFARGEIFLEVMYKGKMNLFDSQNFKQFKPYYNPSSKLLSLTIDYDQENERLKVMKGDELVISLIGLPEWEGRIGLYDNGNPDVPAESRQRFEVRELIFGNPMSFRREFPLLSYGFPEQLFILIGILFSLYLFFIRMNHYQEIRLQNRFVRTIPLFLIIGLEAALTIFLYMEHRILRGHDTWQYFILKYSFLNNMIQSREIAQWIPFMSQGNLATWWMFVQGSFLNSFFMVFPGLIKGFNFQSLFYMDIFFDHIILITGTWLLSRIYYRRIATSFLVTLSVSGSSIWMEQIWWNFHLYYLIPFILFFLHRFLATGSPLFFLVFASLGIVQFYGNLPYFIPIFIFFIFLYVLFMILYDTKDVRQFKKEIISKLINYKMVIVYLLTGGLLIALYLSVDLGTDTMYKIYRGRTETGSVAFNYFLSYGKLTNLERWLDLFSRSSFLIDNTLYAGFAIPLLSFFGIFNRPTRMARVIYWVMIFLFLFTLSQPIVYMYGIYKFIPKMDYFRHVGYIAPLVKVIMIFSAGFAFESFLTRVRLSRNIRVLFILTVVSISLFLLLQVSFPDFEAFILKLISQIYAGLPNQYYDAMPRYIKTNSGIMAFFIFIFMVGMFYIYYRLNLAKNLASQNYFLIVLLGMFVFEMYSYKYEKIVDKTMYVNPGFWNLSKFEEIPYRERRNNNVDFNRDNRRGKDIAKLMYSSKNQYATYWVRDTYSFEDLVVEPFRIDNYQNSLVDFLDARWGKMGNLTLSRHNMNPMYNVRPYPQDPATLGMSGVTMPKLMFFQRAYLAKDMAEAKSMVGLPDFSPAMPVLVPPASIKANILESVKQFVTNGSSGSQNGIPNASTSKSPAQNQNAKIQMFDFNFNNVKLILTLPENSKGGWLYFSNPYNPYWHAKINGEPVDIFNANVGYQAIFLPHKENQVHFYFKIPFYNLVYKTLIYSMLLCVTAGMFMGFYFLLFLDRKR